MSEKYIIPTPGDIIAGKYHIEQELGRGAYGVVFRARQEGIDRHVALKTLLPKAFLETDIVERFEREAQFVGRLNHPNVVGVHDYGRHENLLYMAVEYVEGDTLDEIIANEGPLEPERVRKLVYQMVDALEHAHETGIVHRDLKPANIVILEKPADGSGQVVEVVKVLDFGIAKLIQSETEGEAPETLTQAGTVLGTPHYMSPETIIGERVDHRADVYSLGVMIYEMLTGERPFGAKNSPGVMVKHLRDEPPKLPAHLEQSCWGEAVRRCMEKPVEKRLQSAGDIRRILERRDEGTYRASVPGDSTTKAKALDAPKSGKRLLVPAVAIGALAAVAIAVGFQLIPIGGGETAAPAPKEASSPATEPVVEEPQPSAPKSDSMEDAVEFAGAEPDAGAEQPDRSEPIAVADRSNTVGAPPDEEPSAEKAEAKEAPPSDKEQEVASTGSSASRSSESESRSSKSEPRSNKREPKKAAQKEIRLRIETVPPNARVIVAGKPVGASPVDHTLPSGDEPITVEMHHIGFRTKYRTVVPDKDQTLKVELEKGRLKLIP